MRTLLFTQCTDTRLNGTIEQCEELLNERIAKIKELLNIEGIKVTHTQPRRLDWEKQEGLEEANTQYRCNFSVKKTTRTLTWNNIFELINSVNATYYDLK